MSELPYEGKKYTKTEQGWVEKKSGELATPDYQTLLSKLESAMGSGNKTPLPSASPSTESTISKTLKDDKLTKNFDKLETNLAKLTASIDKLVKSLDKTFRPNSQKNVSSIEAPSQNIPIPKPGIIPAVGRAVNNGLFSQRDPETGKTTSTGLVRKFATTMFPGVANAAYAVRDQYKMAQILNKNQTATPATPAKSRMTSIASNLASKFSAKAATEEKEATKQSAVDLTDNTIKKIAEAVKGDKKEDSIFKKIIDKILDVVKKLVGPIISAISKLLGVFGGIIGKIGKLFGFGGGAKAAGVRTNIETKVDSRGRKYNVDTNTGKRVSNAAAAEVRAAENAAAASVKKPSFLAKTGQGISKLFGGGTKAAVTAGKIGAEAVEIGAKKGGLRGAMGIAGRLGLGALAANPVIDALGIALTPTEANAGEDAALKKMRKEGIDPLTGKLKINKESIKVAEKAEVKAASKQALKIGGKAAAEVGGQVAKKVAVKGGAKILGRLGAGFVPGVGGALDIAAAANAAKEGNPLAAALYGSAGALNIGGAAADLTGIGALGGIPADILGGILTAGGMAAEFTGFGKTKPKSAMIKSAGATQQTQMISAANKKNATLSSKPTASQTIINNVDNSSKSNVQNQSQAHIGPLIDHHTWIDGHRDHMR